MLSLILAISENQVIGRDGDLPWHLPADLKRFKKLTVGHTLLMGRKTFESIGRPLPKRRSLVLSRDSSYQAPGIEVAPSLRQALELAAGDDEVFVIGGARVFEESLPMADRLYLTRVHAEVGGDVTMPEFSPDSWQLVSEERHEADQRHAFPFTFQVFERQLDSSC